MKRIFIALFLFVGSFRLFSQGFSEDPIVFGQQAYSVLKKKKSAAYDKIAYDFQQSWNGKFTEAQKAEIMQISKLMRREGYTLNPHYVYFFGYLANGITNESLSTTDLDKILEVNKNAVQTLKKEKYTNFLYELSTFFGGRYLHIGKSVRTLAEGGSYNFELIGALPIEEPIEVETEPEEMSEEEAQQAEEDLWAQQAAPADDSNDQSSDDWGSNDSWDTGGDDGWDTGGDSWDTGDDGWDTGSDDGWDTGSDDGWGSSTDDGWGNDDGWGSDSDDSWGNDDAWGSNDTWGDEPEGFRDPEPANPKPKRQAIEGKIPDYVGLDKARYMHPAIDGPVIHFENTTVTHVTRFDSLKLIDVDGEQLLKERVFAGKRAKIEWPAKHERNKGAIVHLENFKIRVDRETFWTPNASLEFKSWFPDTVAGTFRYSSYKGATNSPLFISHNSRVNLVLDEKATYTGGIKLAGNELYGESRDNQNGELVILDGKGRTTRLSSSQFHFKDSVITADRAAVSIVNGTDSIFHPSVELVYDMSKEKISLLRNRDFDVTPFHSSFHKMSFRVDLLTWDFDADSINMSITNGGDLVPASFESDQFFSMARYERLTGPFGFHPIGLAVSYAKKYDIDEFNEQELSVEYGYNDHLVRGAMKMLAEYHFAEYDDRSGQVKLLPIAFHYYESAARRKDFDNLYVSSKIADGPNASWNLSSNDLTINGVTKFFVTTDFKIAISPFEGQLVIGENRNMVLNGEIEAGDFDYNGREFQFKYDEFLIHMDVIDSIHIRIPVVDSTGQRQESLELDNQITETKGTLYLNDAENRSGRVDNGKYPYFISESDAVVYFDGSEILDGAYDKSVRFIIPPMEVDDIDSDSASSLIFPGKFNSGDIFPDFLDTLRVMPDNSMGFVHQIPRKGYNLYGTPARTYETITISNEGIRGLGKIDFLNAHIHSEDFIYYPDSVTADAHYGVIDPGKVGVASFPQAELGSYRMYWLPRIDSMYLITVDDPFSFYNGTAQLTGAANITQKGVYGLGSMLTRGSIAESNEMEFKEFSYSARHAKFEVLSDDPEKPAMAGDDISLNFDLTNNTADVQPEKQGVAAISFPYAQMKTSITNAVWYLEDSIITMTKPEDVPIENSYFYTTREDLDSLAFNATNAIYDIKTYELNVQGIPYIQVADAKITPDNNQTVIKANSDLETFQNAKLLFEYPGGIVHNLDQGVIDVISSKEFAGSAIYQLPIAEDTFEIKMENFYLEERFLGKDDIELSSKANGIVMGASNLTIAPGFYYKGDVTFRAFKQALELDGYVKPIFGSRPTHDLWLEYTRTGNETSVKLDVEKALLEDGEQILAGLHYDRNGKLYPTFIEKRKSSGDDDLFLAKGLLSFNPETKNFLIEDSLKSNGEQYEGSTMIYTDSSRAFTFEGPANFIDNQLNTIEVNSSMIGSGNNLTREYEIDAMYTFDFKLPAATMKPMSEDILDIVERLGNAVANDLSIESMLKLGNLIGEAETRNYEEESLKDYVPLAEASAVLNKMIVLSKVKMKWNDLENAWHNTTKLSLSNVFLDDINAKMDGFLEFKKDDTGGDVVNLFIQAAPGSWYYFNYQENSVLVFSSNTAFNDLIKEKQNFGSTKPGEWTLIFGDENETLSFLNNFRKVYFGIDEPYNLVYPDESNVEDEIFDTIEKEEEDDGFGF